MKKVLVFLVAIVIGTAFAETKNITWKVDDTTYATSTCEVGGDLIIPQTNPTKYGYHFVGWRNYTFLEYIESTGTQYIDTGIISKNKMRVFVRFKINAQSKYGYIFGQQEPQGYYGARLRADSMQLQLLAGTSSINVSGDLELNTEYTLDTMLDDSSFSWALNGVSGVENNISFSSKNVTMRLFSGNSTSAGGNIYLPGKDTIYEMKIWDNGVLVRDFVPCKNASNVVGMYDKVSKTFFTNAGTGDFIAGPVKQ